MVPTERERAHLRQIGEIKSRAHAAAMAEHLALPRAQRLARSMALMKRFFRSAPRDEHAPTRFYDRARRLGLYRP
jgi:hypothetical protein